MTLSVFSLCFMAAHPPGCFFPLHSSHVYFSLDLWYSRSREVDGWAMDGLAVCVCVCVHAFCINILSLYIYDQKQKKWRSRLFFCVHQISPNISRSWHLCLVTAVLLPFSALERSVTITEHRSQLSATFAHLKWVTELQNHIKGILFFYLFDWGSEEISLFLVSETIFVSISPKIFGLLAQ